MALILHTKSTKALRDTIRSLRKEYNIRGDKLSKELGRGAAYISQVESGKIKHIELRNIRNIFYRISTVSGKNFNTFIAELIDKNYSCTSSLDLEQEKWLFFLDYKIREFPIPDSIITYITEHFQKLDYSSLKLAFLNTKYSCMINKILEHSKYKYTSLKFLVENEFDNQDLEYTLNHIIRNIISRAFISLSYIEIEIALYYLFLLEDCPVEEIWSKTHKLLYDNGFITVSDHYGFVGELANTAENICEINSSSSDLLYEEYLSSKNCIASIFDFAYNKDSELTVQKLIEIKNNLICDPFFVLILMSQDLTQLKGQSIEKKKEFISELKKLIEKYSSTNEITFNTYDD